MDIAICQATGLPEFACNVHESTMDRADMLPWGVRVGTAIDYIDGIRSDSVEFDWTYVNHSPQWVAHRGMLHITSLYPSLVPHIDFVPLDVSDCNRCVLGQLWGDYRESWEANVLEDAWLTAHGFTIPDLEGWSEVSYLHDLNRAWGYEIYGHRAGVR